MSSRASYSNWCEDDRGIDGAYDEVGFGERLEYGLRDDEFDLSSEAGMAYGAGGRVYVGDGGNEESDSSDDEQPSSAMRAGGMGRPSASILNWAKAAAWSLRHLLGRAKSEQGVTEIGHLS